MRMRIYDRNAEGPRQALVSDEPRVRSQVWPKGLIKQGYYSVGCGHYNWRMPTSQNTEQKTCCTNPPPPRGDRTPTKKNRCYDESLPPPGASAYRHQPWAVGHAVWVASRSVSERAPASVRSNGSVDPHAAAALEFGPKSGPRGTGRSQCA